VTRINLRADAVLDTLNLAKDGEEPMGVAVHPITGEIYVANSSVPPVGDIPPGGVVLDTVSLIPSQFDRSQKVVVGNKPVAVAVDPVAGLLYVANEDSNTISVIALGNRSVLTEIPAGNSPNALVLVDSALYVTTRDAVLVIDTRLRQLRQTIRNVGLNPMALAASPTGRYIYVVNNGSSDISVIDTVTRSVIDTVRVGPLPVRVAVTKGYRPGDGALVYVVNQGDSTVSLVTMPDGENGRRWQTAEETIPVSFNPKGIAVTPDGSKIYVVIQEDSIVEVLGFQD
jgi:YVTN family beta-propeller protein